VPIGDILTIPGHPSGDYLNGTHVPVEEPFHGIRSRHMAAHHVRIEQALEKELTGRDGEYRCEQKPENCIRHSGGKVPP